jgi:hypothetical protein
MTFSGVGCSAVSHVVNYESMLLYCRASTAYVSFFLTADCVGDPVEAFVAVSGSCIEYDAYTGNSMKSLCG